MNTPILAHELETGALRGVLRPCARRPRPIPHPEISPNSRFGGTR
jgi:hypothetical protein